MYHLAERSKLGRVGFISDGNGEGDRGGEEKQASEWEMSFKSIMRYLPYSLIPAHLKVTLSSLGVIT